MQATEVAHPDCVSPRPHRATAAEGPVNLNVGTRLSSLPIQLDDLIQARTVEGIRLEFKATWDDMIKQSATETICAFANDRLNLNGGYVILGN